MVYSTFDSVSKKVDRNYLIQFLNDENRQDEEIDLTDLADPIVIRLTQIAEETAEEIETFLRGRYKLPLSKVPTVIQSISDDRVIFYVKKRRFRNNLEEGEQKLFDATTKTLEKIGRDQMELDAEFLNNDSKGISGEIRTNKTAGDKVFNKEMWSKF